jgi:hypothetical protein
MAALAARAHLPWYRRTWGTWPRLVQVGSLLVVSFLLGVLTYAMMHFPELAAGDSLTLQLNSWLEPLRAVWSAGLAVVSAIGSLLPKVGGWVWIAAGALCVALYLMCIGLGTVIYRLASNK